MDQGCLVNSLPLRETWTSQRFDPADGGCSAQQSKSEASDGLPRPKRACWCIHGWCWRLCQQVTRIAAAGFQCVPAGSKKSVPAGPGQRDDVAVSDGGVCRQKVLHYQTGLRAERGTPNNEDHRQRCVVTARNNKRGDIGVPWWHIRERRRCVVITRKVQTGRDWSVLQGPRTFGGWCPCLGPERSTGAGDLEVGARNCSSWSTRCIHETSCLLPVWKTCGAPTSVWMDSCGNRHHKKEGKRSHQSLGRWNNGRFVGSHGEGDHRKGKSGWPRKRRLVSAGRWIERVGGCELSGDWCAVGEEWSCDWGHLLVATDEWRCSHQPGRARCGDERYQPGTPVESQEITHTHWFAMRVPLDIGHTDKQGQGAHQGGQRDADQTEVGDHKKAGHNLSVEAVLVTSNCNLADRLTRVPQRWYDAMKKAVPVPLLCASSVEAADKIREIHHNSGHPGVRRNAILYNWPICQCQKGQWERCSRNAKHASQSTPPQLDDGRVSWEQTRLGADWVWT